MKKQSQDQTNEQLHIDDAAAAQEEYSLEDIMNEFGGWSKKEEAAPKQQAQTPPPPSTSSQKSLAGMRAPQPRQRPPCTRKLRHGTSSAADSVRPHAGQ